MSVLQKRGARERREVNRSRARLERAKTQEGFLSGWTRLFAGGSRDAPKRRPIRLLRRCRLRTAGPLRGCARRSVPNSLEWRARSCRPSPDSSSGRPWRFRGPGPSRTLSKENQAPDFSTTPALTPRSISSPTLDTPSPYMMSNSTCLNGGATLFLTTLTRVWLPTTCSRSLIAPMRRMSRRTEA